MSEDRLNGFIPPEGAPDGLCDGCPLHNIDDDDCLLRPGDVVSLASGGPPMTVVALTCCGRVQTRRYCQREDGYDFQEWPPGCLAVCE